METLKLPDYRVIDVETSIKNRGELAIGSKASPFYKDNNIVLLGVKVGGSTHITDFTLPTTTITRKVSGRTVNLLVGQNIKFDLLYMLKELNISEFNHIKIWDTMIVEYLITGQQHKYWSLDKLAGKYDGCTLKDDKIKKYWDNDVDTEDIPREELVEYLKGDLDTALKHMQSGFITQKNLGIPTWLSFYQWGFGCINFASEEIKKAQKSFEISIALSISETKIAKLCCSCNLF